MTKRQRYLAALRNEPVDSLVWAPNFDYWLRVNRAEGAVPPRYAGLSRNDIVRAVGGTIWNRASGFRVSLDRTVTARSSDTAGVIVEEYETPVGTVRQVLRPTEGAHRSHHLSEHFVKDRDSLRVMRYVVEATRYEPDYEPVRRALADTGDDGIVLHQTLSVPFIQFAKLDAGYINAFYLWTDCRAEVDALVAAYFDKYLEAYGVLAAGPADVISTGDNMDGTMISPAIFREYALPFYEEAAKIVHAAGKIFEAHWCGRTQTLLPLVPGCGLDVVEAVVTEPMADVTLEAALDMLRGEVVLQGGIPSVLVCEEGGTRDDFRRYMEETVLPLATRRGFILGMGDNVPPNADFARVEMVSGLIAG